MAYLFWTLFNDKPDRTRAKVIASHGILLIFNLGPWLWADPSSRFRTAYRPPYLYGLGPIGKVLGRFQKKFQPTPKGHAASSRFKIL
jgi:hypothetical protein